MKNILITGAASGIGRCFMLHYLKQVHHFVIAVDLQHIDSPDPTVRGTRDDKTRLLSIQCDFSDDSSIKSMVRRISDFPIHLVIHSAGIRGLMPQAPAQNTESTAGRESYDVLDYATLMHTFAVNAAGTFSLLQSIMPQLQQASTQDKAAKVLIMSSRMGSISHNTNTGGGYAYRASKAALNAIVKSFSVDVPEVVFTLVHPGRVETGLVEFKEEGAMTVGESVDEMLRLIETLDSTDSGKFMDRFGEPIGW